LDRTYDREFLFKGSHTHLNCLGLNSLDANQSSPNLNWEQVGSNIQNSSCFRFRNGPWSTD